MRTPHADLPASAAASSSGLTTCSRVLVCMWTIAVLGLLLPVISPFGNLLTVQVGSWAPLAAQAMAIWLLWRFLAGAEAGPRRRAWQFVLMGTCLDFCANAFWNLSGYSIQIDNGMAFALSFAYYALAIGAAFMFYRDLGGSLRLWTTWVDFGTLLLGIGATLWLFYLRPHVSDMESSGVTLFVLLGYAAGNALLMAVVSLLTMQITDWRSERPLVLMMLAVTVAFLGILGWVSASNRDAYITSPIFHSVCISVPYSLLGLAVQAERRRARVRGASHPGGARLSFLPVLSVLIAITLLFGEKADMHGPYRFAMLGFVLAVALLTALRQQGVRYEISGLQRALAIQEAETRLSELVRRSSDLIALVLPGMRLSYVSPAAIDVLGAEPEVLKVRPATCLFGPHHEQRMAQFLHDVGTQREADAGMEVSFQDPGGRHRVVRVNAHRQETEPAVGAISLTVKDVTEELRLEREVLDTAERERVRLSSEIHDGLGQELTGIALLLKSLDLQESRSGGLEDALRQIEEHVDDALRLTQDLASGLSPVPAGNGSLGPMLEALALHASERFGFPVDCRVQPPARALAAAATEHLYCIAQESLNNAARHSGCRRACLELAHEAGHLHLVISDDGRGIDEGGRGEGLGLRMMAYRARSLGGSLSLLRSPGGGAQVRVVVPDAGVIDGFAGEYP